MKSLITGMTLKESTLKNNRGRHGFEVGDFPIYGQESVFIKTSMAAVEICLGWLRFKTIFFD